MTRTFAFSASVCVTVARGLQRCAAHAHTGTYNLRVPAHTGKLAFIFGAQPRAATGLENMWHKPPGQLETRLDWSLTFYLAREYIDYI